MFLFLPGDCFIVMVVVLDFWMRNLSEASLGTSPRKFAELHVRSVVVVRKILPKSFPTCAKQISDLKNIIYGLL